MQLTEIKNYKEFGLLHFLNTKNLIKIQKKKYHWLLQSINIKDFPPIFFLLNKHVLI